MSQPTGLPETITPAQVRAELASVEAALLQTHQAAGQHYAAAAGILAAQHQALIEALQVLERPPTPAPSGDAPRIRVTSEGQP